ncbi:MAG: uroporphyrinogen decarboxylase family protein [Methanomassiliicoccales archaeon]|jgi:uroporphyrinogen decarboxylase
MSYEEIFPPYDMEWHGKSTKRFATPFIDKQYDRIDVDPMMLSHAAVACGYTIRDFYEKPELGIHCLAYVYQLYDLLPVTHWYYSTPWLHELGCELVQRDTLPPIVKEPIISEPGEVDKIEVPDIDTIKKGRTYNQYKRLYQYVQKNIPQTFVPIAYGFDLVGEAAHICGVENFIMWTFTEPEAAHKLVDIFTQTSANGAIATAKDYGSAMLVLGSVLANNDIFSDEAVKDYAVGSAKKYIDTVFREGGGPQIFYHLCGNHETDYKVFHDLIWSPLTVFNVGYQGKKVFPAEILKKEFGNKATIMASVDTKLMIDPNPKAVYEQAKEQIIAGRDSKNGFILSTSCECPPYTLPGNILALTRAARDHGTYGKW